MELRVTWGRRSFADWGDIGNADNTYYDKYHSQFSGNLDVFIQTKPQSAKQCLCPLDDLRHAFA